MLVLNPWSPGGSPAPPAPGFCSASPRQQRPKCASKHREGSVTHETNPELEKMHLGAPFRHSLASPGLYSVTLLISPPQHSAPRMSSCGCPIPGRAPGQAGWGWEQPGLGGVPARGRGWDDMTFKGPIQPQPACDFMIRRASVQEQQRALSLGDRCDKILLYRFHN